MRGRDGRLACFGLGEAWTMMLMIPFFLWFGRSHGWCGEIYGRFSSKDMD